MIGRSILEKSFNTMPFSEAFEFLKQAPRGAKITRVSWDGIYIVKRYDSKYKQYTYHATNGRNIDTEFVFSTDSIKADDWYIISEDELT